MINTKLAQSAIMAFSAITLSAFSSSVQAVNLVTNGGFENTTDGSDKQVSWNTDLTGWLLPAPNNSYTFVFSPGAADTTGANGQYGPLALWGPNNGSANGLPPTSSLSILF